MDKKSVQKSQLAINLKYLREKEQLSQEEFGNLFGKTRDNIVSYERGTEPKLEFLQKISDRYQFTINEIKDCELKSLDTPESGIVSDYASRKKLSQMVNELRSKLELIQLSEASTHEGGIPLIPIEAAAGFGNGNYQVLEHDVEKYYIPPFKGANYLITVRGDSMVPLYYPGDLLGCKTLELNTFFQWNKTYLLDTSQGPLIKRVLEGQSSDYIVLKSENPAYGPFELHRKEINAVAVILGVIRLE